MWTDCYCTVLYCVLRRLLPARALLQNWHIYVQLVPTHMNSYELRTVLIYLLIYLRSILRRC